MESIDYSYYDMLWLGGDMAVSSSLDDITMNHIDSILDVGNENTLWALGNHDYADLTGFRPIRTDLLTTPILKTRLLFWYLIPRIV